MRATYPINLILLDFITPPHRNLTQALAVIGTDKRMGAYVT
jgi:hypothetical protein